MVKFRGLLIMTVCFALLFEEVDGGFFKTLLQIDKAFKSIGKPLCKAFFGFVCPIGIAAGAAAATVGSGGTAAAIAAAGVVAGSAACRLQKHKCKRSVDQSMADYVLVPFSHRFSDYDTNGDKQIAYEEFAYSIMRSLPLRDPEHLPEPFMFADVNKDGLLDMDEFMGAPFMFADNDDIEITGSANRRT